MSLSNSIRTVALKDGIQLATDYNRMVLLREPIGSCPMILLPCSQSHIYHPRFGSSALLHKSMSGTDCLLHPYLTKHSMKLSQSANLISVISEFEDALPMCIFRRISVNLFSHIWKNVSLLVTLLVTRAGCFTILLPKRPLFQNMLNFMSITSLACSSQSHLCHRVHQLKVLLSFLS